MSEDSLQFPEARDKHVDMSWEAIWRRLRRVDELNELCKYLGEFRPVQDEESESQSQKTEDVNE